jgi:hypothetical protein
LISSNIHPYKYGAVAFLVPVLVKISRDTVLDAFVTFRGTIFLDRGRFGPADAKPLKAVTAMRISEHLTNMTKDSIEQHLPVYPEKWTEIYTSTLRLESARPRVLILISLT